MKILRYTLLSALLSTAARAEQTAGSVEAYSRIYRHKDGTRTESFKNGNKNEIQEFTYNRDNILQVKRVFVTDTKGRSRMGYIYDSKLNPLGSIQFGYDSQTNQLVEERQFNRKGQLVRRLFYPGSVKSIKGADYSNRFVALNYDPDHPDAAPVQSKEPVKPTMPVEQSQDEFEPGIPIGRTAPLPANAVPPSKSTAAPAPQPSASRQRFFGKSGNTAQPAPASPPPPPAAETLPLVKKATPPEVIPAVPPAAQPPATKRVAPARRPQT